MQGVLGTRKKKGFLLFFFFPFLAMLCGLWALSSPTGYWTQAPNSDSAEFLPLGHQGSPSISLLLYWYETVDVHWLIAVLFHDIGKSIVVLCVHLLKLSAMCQLHLNKTGRKVKTNFCFFNQSVVSFSFFWWGAGVGWAAVLCSMWDLSSLSGIKPVPPYVEAQSWPLDHQGSLKKKNTVFLKWK